MPKVNRVSKNSNNYYKDLLIEEIGEDIVLLFSFFFTPLFLLLDEASGLCLYLELGIVATNICYY